MRLHRENIEVTFRILGGRYSLEKGDREAALASHIVREIEHTFPYRQIGRSMLQKLFFILSREGHMDAQFQLFMNEKKDRLPETGWRTPSAGRWNQAWSLRSNRTGEAE